MNTKIKIFIVLLLNTILLNVLTSCNAENSDIPLRELPLIDVHAHTFKNSPLEIINLARRENLEKVYIITRYYQKHLPIFQANRDIAKMLIMPEIKNIDWWKEVEPFVLNNRDVIAGVKLHPSVDRYIAGIDNLSELFASAERNRFVIVTHTDSSKNSNENLKKYPNTKLIFYHASPLDSALALVKDYPNVFVDISYTSFNKYWQRKILKEVGADKILFGVDTPLGWPKDSKGITQKHYRNVIDTIAPWYYSDKKTMEKILYKNARRLFKD